MKSKSQQVVLITATSPIIGNVIGAGVNILVAALAGYGSISVICRGLIAGQIPMADKRDNLIPGIFKKEN